jgi:hypothetical protein
MVDFSLDKNVAVKNNDIDLILQQIDILFDTTPKEVLGYEEYGSDYENYLYNLNLPAESIEQSIYSDIRTLQLFNFEPKVKVYILKGTENDIILVDITLQRSGEVYNKSYKIQ